MIQKNIDPEVSVSSSVIQILEEAENNKTEPEEFNHPGEFYANVFGRTH